MSVLKGSATYQLILIFHVSMQHMSQVKKAPHKIPIIYSRNKNKALAFCYPVVEETYNASLMIKTF